MACDVGKAMAVDKEPKGPTCLMFGHITLSLSLSLVPTCVRSTWTKIQILMLIMDFGKNSYLNILS